MPTTQTSRRFRSKEEILQILGDYHKSGLSQRDFAESRNLSSSTFTYWIAKFRKKNPTPTRKRTRLVPVNVVSSETSPATFEVVLPNRRLIRVRGDFDPDLLSKLVRVLEETC